MVEKHWKVGQDPVKHRQKMLQFTWIATGTLLASSSLIPSISGGSLPLNAQEYLITLSYLILCFLFSSYVKTKHLTPHLLMIGMILFHIYLCITEQGINSPASHFLPLIPAIASLLVRSKHCLIYGALVCISILLTPVLEVTLQLRDVSTLELQNSATLILTVIIITLGSYYTASYAEQAIKSIKGKSGFDQITNMPNHYFLIDQLERLSLAPRNKNAKGVLVNFGIDGFESINKSEGQESIDSAVVNIAHVLDFITDGDENLVVAKNQDQSFGLLITDGGEEYARRLVESAQNRMDSLKLTSDKGVPLSLSAVILHINGQKAPIRARSTLDKANYHLLMVQAGSRGEVEIIPA